MNMTNNQQGIQALQQRVARAQAQAEVRQEQIAATRAKAMEVFGTDDIEKIRIQVEAILERNKKREHFQQQVQSLSNQILVHIEAGEIVPEELLVKLDKACEIASKTKN